MNCGDLSEMEKFDALLICLGDRSLIAFTRSRVIAVEHISHDCEKRFSLRVLQRCLTLT